MSILGRLLGSAEGAARGAARGGTRGAARAGTGRPVGRRTTARPRPTTAASGAGGLGRLVGGLLRRR